MTMRLSHSASSAEPASPMYGANHGVRKSVATRRMTGRPSTVRSCDDLAGLAGEHQAQVLVVPQRPGGVHDAAHDEVVERRRPRSASRRG